MSQLYNRLVSEGKATGEVIAMNEFIVTVRGLDGVRIDSQVLFDSAAIGIVRAVHEDLVTVDLLTSEDVSVGSEVVAYREELVIHPSKSLLGRVVDPLLRPLDDGPSIMSRDVQPVFGEAPSFSERMLINQQLETGVTIIDTLFPIVMGQRIAIMGDPKSGKTTFAAQLAINQARLGRLVIIVLIAKRKTDIEQLIDKLERSKAIKHTVIVVADSFAALPLAFLAPYSGCAIAEYFWHSGSDVVIIYDDLSSHAKIYREMALMGNTSPGRESYPGDLFYRHSSLLERAGRLTINQNSLTALPIVAIANNDITGYLSTAIISITDGQIVFDTEEMQKGSTPPVNTGLSVSRVGGRAQETLQKDLAQDIFKSLALYRQASQFAHFGQELPDQYRDALRLGERLRLLFNQEPDEFYSLPEQQIMLKTAFLAGDRELDIPEIKKNVSKIMDESLASETHEAIAEKLVKHQRGKK